MIDQAPSESRLIGAKGDLPPLISRLVDNATAIREGIVDTFSCDGRVSSGEQGGGEGGAKDHGGKVRGKDTDERCEKGHEWKGARNEVVNCEEEEGMS